MPGLGSPAVLDPRTFDLRAFQSTVQSIRERLRVLDSAVGLLQSATSAGGTATALAVLQQQIAALQSRISVVELLAGSLDVIELTAVDTVTVGMPVVPFSVDGCKLADPADPTAVNAMIGLVKRAGVAGQKISVQRRGPLSVPGAVFEPFIAVYVGPAGDLTQHPSYGAVAIPVGVAISTDTVWVRTGAPSLLAPGFDAEYEGYMPASVALVTEALDFIAEFNAMPDGLMVKVGSQLQGRRLTEGARIWIDNADGVEGNPVISYVGEGVVRVLETSHVSDACSAVLGP